MKASNFGVTICQTIPNGMISPGWQIVAKDSKLEPSRASSIRELDGFDVEDALLELDLCVPSDTHAERDEPSQHVILEGVIKQDPTIYARNVINETKAFKATQLGLGRP